MATRDFTTECSQSAEVPVEELRERGCAVCRNNSCTEALWGESKWTQRVRREQEQKLDNPQYADDKHPKHAEFAGQEWTRELPELPEDWQKHPAEETAQPQQAAPQRTAPQQQGPPPPMGSRPRNTPVPSGGIMLGGAPAPTSAGGEDPWAPKEKKVKVGATIQIGKNDG